MKLTFTLIAVALMSTSVAMAQSNTLKAGQSLVKGQKLTSENGKFSIQKDHREGRFDIYSVTSYGLSMMIRGLSGGYDDQGNQKRNDAAQLVLQTDGNLVLYDDQKKAKWDSKTQGSFDAKYRTVEFKPVKGVLENDGSFVLYSATGKAVWKR
jgi:hypothetical protein